nr:docking protein 2 [Misgurnus anguillicaudatus]
MDVITKEGALYLQGVKFGKKVWRKTWLILFDPSAPGTGRIELYDTREARGLLGSGTSRPAGLKKTDKRMIRLSDCLSITPAPDESCPVDCSAFFLNTISRTYTFAAPTKEGWMSALCQLAFQRRDEDTGESQRDKCMPLADNELYSSWGAGQFQVKVQSTDASQRCGLSGSYLLSVKKDVISLLDLKTGQAIHSWSYRVLRRFGQVKGGIAFEVGRQCHTGAGHFIFLSNQSSHIHKTIEEAFMHHSVQELLAEASAPPQEPAPQPPPPNKITQDRSKVNKLPPIKTNQNRPCQAVPRKKGQRIHKAIEDALTNQSAANLPAPSTTHKKDPLPPPPSAKPRTQDRRKDKPMVTYHPPKQERLCPPVMQTQTQLTNSSDENAHIYSNVQEPQAQSDPRSLPCVPVSRRKFSLPAVPCINTPLNCQGDVLYASINPTPRSNTNLPKVPTPPSPTAHFRVYTNEDTDVRIDQKEPSENKDEDNPYMNWMVKTNAEQDQPHTDVIYSTVNYAAKVKNKNADIDGQERFNVDQQSSVINSTIDFEIPVDFKQTLSNILLKEQCKKPSSYPGRSLGGSSDGLDRKDDEMTH